MNKRVGMMCIGDVFVGDNGVLYAVVGCGDLIQPSKARPCLRLTYNLEHCVDFVPSDMVGRCVEWHELDQRLREYQLSVLQTQPNDVGREHDKQFTSTITHPQSGNEERCRLFLRRLWRAMTDKDPTALHTLSSEDLMDVERLFNEYSRLKNELTAAHNKLDAAGMVFSPLVRRVECLVAERDQAKKATVVVDGPCAKYIHDALDKAGVPKTFGVIAASLFERVEWLIKKCDELKLATTELQTLRNRSLINEGFAKINKALESLKPAFDAIEVTVAIRDSLEKCAQTTATEVATNALDKALAESNARINIERNKAHNAGRKMVRKAWDLLQAMRVTVDNKDVKPNEPRHEPTSLLDVFAFAQQQHETADRELCAIDEDDEGKAERAAYLRGVATAHAHVMALLAALGTRGYELVLHKFTE